MSHISAELAVLITIINNLLNLTFVGTEFLNLNFQWINEKFSRIMINKESLFITFRNWNFENQIIIKDVLFKLASFLDFYICSTFKNVFQSEKAKETAFHLLLRRDATNYAGTEREKTFRGTFLTLFQGFYLDKKGLIFLSLS